MATPPPKDRLARTLAELPDNLSRDLERVAGQKGRELVTDLVAPLIGSTSPLQSDRAAEALRTGLCLIRDLDEATCRTAFGLLDSWPQSALKSWWLRAVFDLPGWVEDLGRAVRACLAEQSPRSEAAALELVKKAPALVRRQDRGTAELLFQLVIAMAPQGAGQAVEAFLSAPDLIRPLPTRVRISVLKKALILARAGESGAASKLLHRAGSVFDQAGFVGLGKWFNKGTSLQKTSWESFFDLASPAGRRALDLAAGGLSLDLAAQALRLYARALTGEAFEVGVLGQLGGPDQSGLHSGLAAGWLVRRTILLPARQKGYKPLETFRARLALTLKTPPAELDFLLSFPDPWAAGDIWSLIGEFRAIGELLSTRPGLARPLRELNRLRRAGWSGSNQLRHPAWRVTALRLWGGRPKTIDPEALALANRVLEIVKEPSNRPITDLVREVYDLLTGPVGRSRPLAAEEVEGPKLKFGSLDPRIFESSAGLDPSLSQKAQAENPMNRASGRSEFLASLRQLSGRLRSRDRDTGGGPEILYPEWDQKLADYKPDWVRVIESASTPVDLVDIEAGDTAGTNLPPGLVRQVRRRFQRLRPRGLNRSPRRLEGQELDLSATVERLVDQARGSQGSDRIYLERRLTRRSVAAALLVDISGSTARRIGPKDGPRVVDVARDGLWLFAEALAGLGDDFALFGFSGQGREAVLFNIIKDFDQIWSASLARRLDNLAPGDQNRDGAALRHAAARLKSHPARRKVLIYISDGRPDDYEYSGSYAVADTRRALAELDREGIKPFCLTIDSQAREYIQAMMGSTGYCIIDDVRRLPAFLPRLYRRLAG